MGEPPATILVVDDTPQNVAILSTVDHHHYRVVAASCGEEALATSTQSLPHLHAHRQRVGRASDQTSQRLDHRSFLLRRNLGLEQIQCVRDQGSNRHTRTFLPRQVGDSGVDSTTNVAEEIGQDQPITRRQLSSARIADVCSGSKQSERVLRFVVLRGKNGYSFEAVRHKESIAETRCFNWYACSIASASAQSTGERGGLHRNGKSVWPYSTERDVTQRLFELAPRYSQVVGSR